MKVIKLKVYVAWVHHKREVLKHGTFIKKFRLKRFEKKNRIA
jgi:hypothetical protein